MSSFPRRQAATRRFTLGAPRRPTVSPDGARVVLLRSRAGDDPLTCLWLLDVASGEEHLLVDPRDLDVPGEEDLPPEERARRERVREQSGGVVEYALDAAARLAVFVLSGRAFTVDLVPGAQAAPLPVDGPVVDPRPDPTGARVAFVRAGTLHVHELSTGTTHVLAGPAEDDGPGVSWGLAEFVAAEEMNRYRGYWWSPDGSQLAVARVDDAPVTRWWIADPAHPDRAPVETAYPAAGTANADVTLALVDLDGTRVPVDLGDGTEYLAGVTWDTHDLLVTVSTRDQRRVDHRRVDPDTGESSVLVSETDDVWVDLVPGVPAHLGDGALVRCADSDDTRRLVVGDEVVTPLGLQVRAVADVDGDTVLFTASERPEDVTLWAWSRHGGATRVGPQYGVWAGRRAGGVTVLAGGDLDNDGVRTYALRADGRTVGVASHAESPGLQPAVRRIATDRGGPSVAVVLPTGHVPGSRKLPVLLDPYGGPHAQRVLATRAMFLTSQWFADQGFAVVVADGRGTPGQGPAYERAVWGDLAGPVLDDQVAALHAAAEQVGDLDLDRVGIRGWSFGGYLAALAVLRRPDVFHAAVAGAPVTDWRLYDTHYTERYLGHPDTHPDAYARSSITDETGTPARPLMLVHGLADDNVVAAHTLRLSSSLLAAGHPHTVLPLSGVTHMTPQEVVAENLLLLQVAFLRDALG
ncbi:prolyl oligopeptidase family serine peptidase [Actinomycetospora lutea]|uniref:S9 family peptidase n=1 Tax=Actinomycetospora lutea TaxID=663604 RepID=UPI0023653622|nr:prolyl oligopeptidase family serine peptidase [Actinomycetospora lutea]MDD7937910.1 prolyl oligopeptidase family serine peptidase [Actinomycetospora lutea]